MKLIHSWHSGQQSFTHQTSGSTGRPKKIEISREKIELSARATLAFIDPKGMIKTSLLCLNPAHIGGAMVIYRALIFNQDLTLTTPSSSLLSELEDNQMFDLVSMAPLQFKSLSKHEIERFKIILIGGAPMPIIKNEYATSIYSTYGMTETVSHIALRPIDKDIFKTTGDTTIKQGSDQSLSVKGSITDHKWLETNDIIEYVDRNSFKWIGRKDFIINSGGIKVNPEKIEDHLSSQFKKAFMVGYIPDANLGRRVVILSSENPKKIDFSGLNKYHIPKEIFWNQTIFQTESKKIDRRKTQEHFEKSLW
ncbi:MAG: AMP-binding protein [Ekhidna sp.]